MIVKTKRKLTEQEKQELNTSLWVGGLIVSGELLGLGILIFLWPYYIPTARIIEASLLVCVTFIGPPCFVLNFQERRAKYRAGKAEQGE